MKIKENMADRGAKLRKRLEEVLESETGFIILADSEKLTDFYQGVCPSCVVEEVNNAVRDFDRLFGLPKTKKKTN